MELIKALLAHELFAEGGNNGVEGDLNCKIARLDNGGDLHRDHIEDPSAVFHGVGQIAHAHGVISAPYALKIYRALTEGGFYCTVDEGEEQGGGQHGERLGFVAADVKVDIVRGKQL